MKSIVYNIGNETQPLVLLKHKICSKYFSTYQVIKFELFYLIKCFHGSAQSIYSHLFGQ